jgi:hypothetical protein
MTEKGVFQLFGNASMIADSVAAKGLQYMRRGYPLQIRHRVLGLVKN